MSETVRALVVYESMFGNTERLARAIRDGLRQSVPTEIVPAHRARLSSPPTCGCWSSAARPTRSR